MNLTLFITGVYDCVVYKFLVYLRTYYFNDFLKPKGKGPVNFSDCPRVNTVYCFWSIQSQFSK